jgi:hypothetical protein
VSRQLSVFSSQFSRESEHIVKIYRFGPEVGHHISHFDSDFTMSPILRTTGDLPPDAAAGDEAASQAWHAAVARRGVRIASMHIGPGGRVGYHQATVPQLFLVVAGAGWVRGAAPERTPIQPYTAAFWTGGEWHGAGSETGLTAIVIEGETLDPAQFMPEA